MEAPPVEATRQQRLETWTHQYRKDDGYTDDPVALLGLCQLLEDTGGLDHDLAATEELLGDSLKRILGPAYYPTVRDQESHEGSQGTPGQEGGEEEEQSQPDPVLSPTSDARSQELAAQEEVDFLGVQPPTFPMGAHFRVCNYKGGVQVQSL